MDCVMSQPVTVGAGPVLRYVNACPPAAGGFHHVGVHSSSATYIGTTVDDAGLHRAQQTAKRWHCVGILLIGCAARKRQLTAQRRLDTSRTSMHQARQDVPLGEEAAAALHERIRQVCESGQAQLCADIPPQATAAKTLVVQCSGSDMCRAILCVLPLSERLCLKRLRSLLSHVGVFAQDKWIGDLSPECLASAEEAEELVGCAMGLVPPICIEPALPVVMDASFFHSREDASIAAGAACHGVHLHVSASGLRELTGATVCSIISESSADAAAPLNQQEVSKVAKQEVKVDKETLFPLLEAQGPAVHMVAVVASVRKVAKTLAFVDVIPPGSHAILDGQYDVSLWRHPSGSGKAVRLQLILGQSMEQRLGTTGLGAVLKRLRPKQLLYVAGHVSFKQEGDGTPEVLDLPDGVQRVRQAQLEAGIVDIVAEQIRVLEEVHVHALVGGTAGPPGCQPEFQDLPPVKEGFLALGLSSKAVHVVSTAESLKKFAAVVQERINGTADPPLLSPAQEARQSTPLLTTVGIDAEWRPDRKGSKSKMAVLQIAFRRSVFLLDLLLLTDSEALQAETAYVLRLLFEAEHVYKVGFALQGDFGRLQRTLPDALPKSVPRTLCLGDLTKEAFPDMGFEGGLSKLSSLVLQ
eukprot:TRINITY_DN48811_c0_g1_i2.p1 TRINITY_DN48811_c0_g1~~TRINITY_DN48811_c0_g1_i2.p1  ORF type:complete len:664 (+),score=125.36 TRINITY_DN48811_c0_g1_i2:77-1993(+)